MGKEHRCAAMGKDPDIVVAQDCVHGQWCLWNFDSDDPRETPIRFCPFCGVELGEGEDDHA